MSITGTSYSPSERAQLLVDGILRDLHSAVRRVVNIYGDGNEVLDGVIIPEALRAIEVAGLPFEIVKKAATEAPAYTGERRDLCQLVNLPFYGVPWGRAVDVIASCYTRHNKADKIIKPGDYIDIPVNVESAEIKGCEYESIHANARMVVTHVFPDKVILNFEDIIGYGPMNSDDTNKGGFVMTALSVYLNTKFLDSAFGSVKQFLAPNKDGLLVSIPTRYEVFGAGPNTVNWGEVVRHEYYKKCTNRIKVGIDDMDDTKFWWNYDYDPYSGGTTRFCYVDGNGSAANNYAGNSGGFAPAICIS